MDEVLLVDTLEPLHDFHHDFNSVVEGEGAAWQAGLVGEEVALLAVLHDDYDKVRGWVSGRVLEKECWWRTMLG